MSQGKAEGTFDQDSAFLRLLSVKWQVPAPGVEKALPPLGAAEVEGTKLTQASAQF